MSSKGDCQSNSGDAPEVDHSASAPQYYPIAEGLQIPYADGLQVCCENPLQLSLFSATSRIGASL